MSVAIKLNHVSKQFDKDQNALTDINFEIQEGEIVALIGPSGSGKSTLLRLVSALTPMSSNKDSAIEILSNAIQINGKPVKHSKILRRKLGFIFQQFNLINRLSVLTNVLIGTLGDIPAWRGLLGIFSQSEKERAFAALDRVGLKGKAYKKASELSGGQQQRVAIARALMQKAPIILADEPIASLDPKAAKKVMKILKSLNEEDGKTVLVTLHQVDYAKKYCNRAIALKDGELYFDGPTSQLTYEKLAHLYDEEQIHEMTEHSQKLKPKKKKNSHPIKKLETI